MPTRFANCPTLPLHRRQLLLQVGAFELLPRFAQRQRQQVLFHQRLIVRRFHRQFPLNLLQPDLFPSAPG